MNCDANYLVKASDFGFVFLFLSSWMATFQTSPTEDGMTLNLHASVMG